MQGGPPGGRVLEESGGRLIPKRGPWWAGRGLKLAALGVTLTLVLAFAAGCGGGGDGEATVPPPSGQAGGSTSGAAGGNTLGGSTVEANGQAEALKDQPFTLNTDLPIPPDFRAAYQRKALLVVEFFQMGKDPYYPQGLQVDDFVNRDLKNLRPEYPEVEYFTYDITNPGTAGTSEELQPGQYGTLAAQLDVGYTPFIIMLAPRGEQYVVENLFQGYVDEGVLDQALSDLSNVDVAGNSSDVDLQLDRVELTESGGGVEYFTVTNNGKRRADLQGFSLRVMDAKSGEATPESEGVEISDSIKVRSGRTVSVGRVPDINDADGRQVRGTFSGGDGLGLKPGDQLALLDSGGAVVDTISL